MAATTTDFPLFFTARNPLFLYSMALFCNDNCCLSVFCYQSNKVDHYEKKGIMFYVKVYRTVSTGTAQNTVILSLETSRNGKGQNAA